MFYLIGSMLSYYPHYISYFNEFIWDRKQSYRFLADSNLDWLQNRWYLDQYLTEHPDVQVNPHEPVAGIVVVEANFLVGVFNSEHAYSWLRNNFTPIDHIAYSYLVYSIPEEKLKKILQYKDVI